MTDTFRESLELFHSLLVLSLDDNSQQFPTRKGLILDELVNAVVTHTTGLPRKVHYYPIWYGSRSFEETLWAEYETKADKRKLSQNLQKQLPSLIKPANDKVGLYDFVGGFADVFDHSLQDVAELSYSFVKGTQDKYIPALNGDKATVEAIAKQMRVYIKEDLEAIRNV